MKRSQIIISSIIIALLALFSALGGMWGNIATSNPPAVLKPLLPYSWYFFGGFVVLGLIVAIWQFLYQTHISNPAAATTASKQISTQTTTTPQATSSSSSPYHSCFLCYSHHDQPFADKLYADLQAKGVQCWYAAVDLKMGDKIRPTIEEAIQKHAKLLLVLSQHSVTSTWVENEVEAAFEQEDPQQRKFLLFPIRLDDTVMHTKEAWAATIRRTRWIGDFTKWQQQGEYNRAFDRLLRDLKA